MDDAKRNAYMELVESINLKCLKLSETVRKHAGENVIVTFTAELKYRIVDKTDPNMVRDYGWFGTLDEVKLKLDRLYPLAGILE